MFRLKYFCLILLLVGLFSGCSSYQPTKDVWKGTKSLWYTYASPPASVNYDDKGDISPAATRLARSMLAVDRELTRLERVMLNADRPPTQEWISNFMSSFPWIGGIAGVKYDGVVLGQEPTTPLKDLDYIPLLYEDKKQKRSALRGDVQITAMGPEVLLAAPLYESSDFLGVVCAHFDMRTLATQFSNVEKLVILSPYGLLWAGEYDFAKTPLAGLDWAQICRESTQGTCSNAIGTFLYQVRFLGNLPLIFATAEGDGFPTGDGSVAQGLAFFPKEREKLPVPPQPEHSDKSKLGVPAFVPSEEQMMPDLLPPDESQAGAADGAEKVQQVERQSPPVRKTRPQRSSRVRERSLEGENIRIERPAKPVEVKPDLDLDLGPDVGGPTLPGGRPSPFGASGAEKPETGAPSGSAGPEDAHVPSGGAEPELPGGRPSPFGAAKPAPETGSAPAEAPKQQEEPATLPGGRPSPFGS